MNVNLRLASVRRESQSERILDLKKTESKKNEKKIE